MSVVPERLPAPEAQVLLAAPEPHVSALQGNALKQIEDLLAASPWIARRRKRIGRRRWKRALDVTVALPAFVVAAPLVLVAAVLVLLVNRHRPFYADVRVGLGGRPFRCFKLRTMDADPAILEDYLAAHPEEWETYRKTRKLRFDPRITRIGSFLRRSSIDEFPQLWNVLRGEMSVVGPRPLAPTEFVSRGRRALPLTLVPPGLSGLWQIRGRSDLTLRRRIALDNFYANRASLPLDLIILAKTPLAVLKGKGAR